jgi:hypothetical protein
VVMLLQQREPNSTTAQITRKLNKSNSLNNRVNVGARNMAANLITWKWIIITGNMFVISTEQFRN